MKFTRNPHQLIELDSVSEYPIKVNFFPNQLSNESNAILDTLETYNKNLKTQPIDWYYRNNSVTYTLNSQQYRCNDFTKIDWSNSIIIFGCSHVFGVGVDDNDTLPNRLQELCNLNVINLGAGGTSQQFSLYNMLLLKKHNVKPKAIIHVWTDSRRIFHVDNNLVQKIGGPWNNYGLPESYPYENLFYEFKTHITNYKFNRLIADIVYNDIPVIHASYYKHDIDSQTDNNIVYLPKIDAARDLSHPGINSFKLGAKILFEKLKSNKWYPSPESNREL